MNKLEKAICAGVIKAQKQYISMNSWWLHHAPESFLSTIVGINIAETLSQSVYIDTDIRRVFRERKSSSEYKRGPGRPPKVPALRPDIQVWKRAGWDIQAAIEVKKAYEQLPIKKDVIKLKGIIGKSYGPEQGYILAYTDAKNISTLESRFEKWSQESGLVLIHKQIGDTDEKNYTWGFALIRLRSA